MATAKIWKVFTTALMPAGATWNYEWNNIPDYPNQGDVAYFADIDPYYQGSSNQGYAGKVTAEFTYQRRMRIIGPHDNLEAHHDVLGTITNLGPNDGAQITFYLVVFK